MTDYKLTEEDKKRLTSFMFDNKIVWKERETSTRQFTTPSDQHAVFTKLVEVGKWAGFDNYLWDEFLKTRSFKDMSFVKWNLESPERFCKLVSDYLKEVGK